MKLPLAPSSAGRTAPQAPENAAPILIITPPSIFLLDERVFVNLGILKVGAVLEAAGYPVEHLDLNGVENFEDAVRAHLRSSEANTVAITATTPQLPAATKIVRVVRDVSNSRVILGGPHATLVHSAFKLEKKAGRVGRGASALAKLLELFDVVVSGDGESAVFEALRADAPRVVDADDPKNGMFMTDAVYDASPFPARHLVDVESYRYSIEGHRACSLIAQLGCPYGCGFCGGRNSKMLRKIRTRTTESVVREVEMLHRAYGFTGFMLYDDELNVNKNIVELMDALTSLQRRLGVEFRFRGFVKSELFTEKQAAAMSRAGFRWILCGFEAASPRILENINKRAMLEDNTRVMSIARSYGLKVKALMSVGHPGESEETIRSVRDWLLEVRPADFDCTVITTYPGTPYYDEALPNPKLGRDVWTYRCPKSGDALHSRDVDYTEVADYYKGDPSGGYESYVFTDHLSGDEIVRLRDWVEKDVREKLAIPFNPGVAAIRYEHSMGQGAMPKSVLRRSPEMSAGAR